jgi:hypothetical protein
VIDAVAAAQPRTWSEVRAIIAAAGKKKQSHKNLILDLDIRAIRRRSGVAILRKIEADTAISHEHARLR